MAEDKVDNKVEIEKKDEQIEKRWKMAGEIREVSSNLPLSVFYKALEINKDVVDQAVNWIFEKAEGYMRDHPEVIKLEPPLKESMKDQ